MTHVADALALSLHFPRLLSPASHSSGTRVAAGEAFPAIGFGVVSAQHAPVA